MFGWGGGAGHGDEPRGLAGLARGLSQASIQRGERPRLLVEPLQLLLAGQRAVADVVDAPRERVHGAHRRAPVGGQQPDAVVEVRGRRARDALALPIGALRVGALCVGGLRVGGSRVGS